MNKTTIILFVIVFIAIIYLFYSSQQNKKMWQGQMGLNSLFMKKMGITGKELAKAAAAQEEEDESDDPDQVDDHLEKDNEPDQENDPPQPQELPSKEQVQENIKKGIEFMAERIASGQGNFSKEEQQFYENYKQEIERALAEKQKSEPEQKTQKPIKKKKVTVKIPERLTITKKGINRKKNNKQLSLADNTGEESGESEDNKLSGE